MRIGAHAPSVAAPDATDALDAAPDAGTQREHGSVHSGAYHKTTKRARPEMRPRHDTESADFNIKKL
jgi:hypothetical protein